ncbi:hypothetical protein LWI29_009386 [Acer saccharum]|uniref:Uncharacterized protein n=1 Tax=Acer saccharum TaxID=4024 RepID=A0AA39W2N9_ACESA|nr:hypothetical protein LWI29_009386 [Acer saccharum]
MPGGCSIRALWILNSLDAVVFSRRFPVVERQWKTACKTENESCSEDEDPIKYSVLPLLPTDPELAASFAERKRRFAKKPFGDFCGDCYKTTSWVEAYSGNIFPVGHPSEWTIPEGVRSMVVYPPPFRAQAGRPKRRDTNLPGNIEMVTQDIARFVVNPVTTDKIVGMHSHVRFLYHQQHQQHLQQL